MRLHSIMRSLVASLLLILSIGAFAKDKPRITIEVVNSETSQREHTRTMPGRRGTAETNCNTNGTTNGTINDYGIGPIRTNSTGSANTNCTTTTTAATPPQTRTVSITQEHIYAILPDGRHVTLWCQQGYRHCDNLQPGKYEAEIDGNALFVYVPELSGKEHKIKYRAVSLQVASAAQPPEPETEATAPVLPSSAEPSPSGNSTFFGLSIETLKEQAASGDAEAQTKLGLACYLGQGVAQNYKQAALWLRKAAEQGNADAQSVLGELYSDGEGVPKDQAQAVVWWRKAAEQGIADAQSELGYAYSNGQGVPKDYAQAMVWWHKAAEQGDAKAQLSLGMSFSGGFGVPKDYAEAYFWLDIAAAGNLADKLRGAVVKYQDDAASHLTLADLSRVQERARKWFEDHSVKPQ